MSERKIKLPEMNPGRAADEIANFIIKIITSNHKTGCVIGLSGGVDSTTTAALTNRAFDIYNRDTSTRKLELIGYILSSKTNASEDADDGQKVAERLGIRYETHSIEPIVSGYQSTNYEALKEVYHKGNLMSRIRANILSTKAATEKKLVVGTGNRDEDFGIGYYTLFGDGAVHMSPIAGLSKRLVRIMAEYLGFGDIANRIPTAGLEPGQTDFGDLGYDYDVVELVTEALRQDFTVDEIVKNSMVKELVEMQIERYREQFGRVKLDSVEAVMNDIIKRHRSAEQKAKLISPSFAEVSLVY